MADENEELPEVTEEAVEAPAEPLGFVMDVPLRMRVELGRTQLLVKDVLQLGEGSVVELDRLESEPVDVLVNDRLVARGEVTLVEDRVAVKIVEVLGVDDLGGKLS